MQPEDNGRLAVDRMEEFKGSRAGVTSYCMAAHDWQLLIYAMWKCISFHGAMTAALYCMVLPQPHPLNQLLPPIQLQQLG